MIHRLSQTLIVLFAASSLAATPREFVADRVGDQLAKLKKAEKHIDDLPGILKDANESIADGRSSVKEALTKLADSQKSLDEAIKNTNTALEACSAMGETLATLPAQVTIKADLSRKNTEQCDRIKGIKADLLKTSASNADTRTQLIGLDAKLVAAREKLARAKELPSTDRLNDVITGLEVVLKVNKAAMPDFPNIKELK
ncbi:MAG: hypothetical protein Q8L14_31715 [Myxococcales bacterium]|nr:hypothetical protein [Myxococcales bacterium]